MPRSYCVVDFCNSNPYEGTLIHRFPADSRQRQHWIDFVRATGREDWVPKKTSRICSLHFEPSCYMTVPEFLPIGVSRSRLVLRRGVIPTIYPHMIPSTAESGSTPPPKRPRHEDSLKQRSVRTIPFIMRSPLAYENGLAVLPDSLNTAAVDVAYTNMKLKRKDVQTQCAVLVSFKTTQADIGRIRRCTRVRIKKPVKDSECQTDLELADISLVEEMPLQSDFSDTQR
ncbi:THAP domain-containing protein 10 [Rhipicephalus microplus]|uniref:THAP domain-containing protein 10 n=1 Tax=Rhipicephalus microplus TaxID=6941 RepID=UPI003F6CD5DD